ncbi:hypothetical protein OHW04_02165 [Acinetobacter baumannii]|nr:hypothetical protein [Acinetobacter baumannii]
MDKCREEFEKKLKCQDLLSELTFCEETSSYVGDILPTNLATINGAYWAWVKRQAEIDEQQAKVEELQTLYTQQGINMWKMQKRVDSLIQTMEELLEEMKYPTATFEEVIVCGVRMLEQALKGEG